MRASHAVAGAVVACAIVMAAHVGAQQVTFTGGSGGGGVTVGDPVSGGTASRLIHTDSSGNVATAATALGAGLELSGNARVDGTSDLRGNISNGGSATCFTGVTGVVCIADDIAVNTGGNSFFYLRAGTTSTQSGAVLINSGNTIVGGLRYWGSASVSALQNKVGLVSAGGAAEVLIGEGTSDRAAGYVVVRFADGANLANTLATIDGAGNLSLASGATRSRGTITLSGGTGTATVNSGAICVCTDTSATNVVRCSVSSTTLTATGTDTDVIAYLCL